MWHICETREVHTEFWWGKLWERGHLEDPGVDGCTILEWVKVVFTVEQAMKAQAGIRGIVLLFL
jgi:hypothetical protein